ncbi:Low-affinity putrescine importer PlaP [compost metagenome]
MAFSFVNLSVINHCYLREGNRQGLANKLMYLVLPTIGFCIIVSLWLDLNEHSLMFGGIWALLGLVYLAWLTKAFTAAPRNYVAE